MSFITNIFGYPLGFIMKGLYLLTSNYIIALILFTLVTKVLMFPLAVKQQKSTAQMAAFKPKMDNIQKKFANDKNRQNEEMMKLYTEYGYNPSSGCLPMLIQFPILFGLINVIYNPLTHLFGASSAAVTSATKIATTMLGSSFSSINPQVSIINAVKENASAFSEIFTTSEIAKISAFDMSFMGLDLSAVPTLAMNLLILIPILSGISMVVSSWATMKFSGTGEVTGNSSKIMMYSMSLFSVVFSFQVPAGVGVYWIVSNVLTVIQSYILNKVHNPKKLADEYEAKIRAIADSKKKKVKVEINKDGEKQVVEKTLSEKELNRLRLAKARELDAARYGEEEDLPTFGEVEVISQKEEDKDAQ